LLSFPSLIALPALFKSSKSFFAVFCYFLGNEAGLKLGYFFLKAFLGVGFIKEIILQLTWPSIARVNAFPINAVFEVFTEAPDPTVVCKPN